MIKPNFFLQKKIQILSVTFEENDVASFYTLFFRKDKNQLLIENKVFYNNIQNVIESFDNKTPLLIHFSGKGIINKKTSNQKAYISELIFNQNSEDFYFFELTEENNMFISFVRKQVIDSTILKLQKNNIFCLQFSIGPFISSILKSKNNILFSDNFKLFIEEGSLSNFVSVENIEENVNLIGNINLNGSDTSLFGAAINYLFPNPKIKRIESSITSTNKKEFSYKSLFNHLGAFVLSFFLLALLTSSFLLRRYNNKHIELQTKMVHFQGAYDKIKHLKKNINDKEDILNNSGIYNKSFLSFYINDISKSVSNKILLNNLSVSPILHTIKKNEKVKINSQKIIILGESISSMYFSEWLKVLKKKPWIVKVEIIEYRKTKNKNDQFKLIIQL